jgi:TrmH family RNA methyltransferase
MISKNQLKQLRALMQKKQRKLHNLFLVQGEKNVLELLNSKLVVKQLFATTPFINKHQNKLGNIAIIDTTEDELAKASSLVSNNAAIAIVEIPSQQAAQSQGLTLVLDGISDPGNLGTIIRVADWYGIEELVISSDCADPYNPKVISATMGSFTRVNIIQTELSDYFAKQQRPVYGAFLEGISVHCAEFEANMILVMGSESHGIRESIQPYITQKITIPAFGQAESLNVAMASGIILDNIKRCQG